MALLDQDSHFPGLGALPVVFGTALVIAFASTENFAGRMLQSRLLVGVGLISYSTYLWHQPLLAFARVRSPWDPSPALVTACVVGSFAFAYVSWRYVERPFRDRVRWSARAVWRAAAAMMIIGVGFGVFGHMTGGVLFRGTWANSAGLLDERMRPNQGLSPTCDREFTRDERCRTDDLPVVLLWGDSHAMHLGGALVESLKDQSLIQMTKSSCGPFPGVAPVMPNRPETWPASCIAFNDSVLEFVRQSPSVKYAVLSSSFHQYVADDARVTTRTGEVGVGDRLVAEALLRAVDSLRTYGVIPVVVTTPPRNGEDIGRCLRAQVLFAGPLPGCDMDRGDVAETLRAVHTLMNQVRQRVPLIDLDTVLCTGDRCRASFDSILVYRDESHLSYEGSRAIGERLDLLRIFNLSARRPP